MACFAVNADAQQSYVVGTWNLEHFHDGARRGFPESSISARKNSDYEFVASIIKNLDIKLLILEEINGRLVELVDEDDLTFEDDADSGDAGRGFRPKAISVPAHAGRA